VLVLLQASIVEANIRRQNATQTVQSSIRASDNPCASGDSIITALNPSIGYREFARIATGRAISDLVVQQREPAPLIKAVVTSFKEDTEV